MTDIWSGDEELKQRYMNDIIAWICSAFIYFTAWCYRIKTPASSMIDSSRFGDYVKCDGYKDFIPSSCRVKPRFRKNCRNADRTKTLYGMQFIPWYVTHFRNEYTLDLMITDRGIRTDVQMFSLIRPLFRGKCEAKHLPHLVKAFIEGDKQLQWLRTNNWSVLKTLKTKYNKVVFSEDSLKLKVDFSADYSFSKHLKGFRLVDDTLNTQPKALDFLGSKFSCMCCYEVRT